MKIEQLRIEDRFRGPPRSGNGGYVCGVIARRLQGPAAVRLKAPPPLGVELRLESSADQSRLYHEQTVIGEGKLTTLSIQAPAPPSLAQARIATRSFIGFKAHPFPGCFVCGTERLEHDGLRIFPGPVETGATIACPWSVDDSLVDEHGRAKPEFLWSVLDCPGAFAVMPPPGDVTIVLGELSASIVDAAHAREECVVSAWSIGRDGRKRFAGSAIHGADDRLIAYAHAVWIDVPSGSWK